MFHVEHFQYVVVFIRVPTNYSGFLNDVYTIIKWYNIVGTFFRIHLYGG